MVVFLNHPSWWDPLLGVLVAAPWLGGSVAALAAGALACGWLPRLIAAGRFRQPLGSVLLHPLGVLALLVYQWQARLRHWRGQPVRWKGRAYGAASLQPAPPVPGKVV